MENTRITPEIIKAHIAELLLQQQDQHEHKGIFTLREANKWLEIAHKRPKPRMLFSEFWFEGEICILFADTNLGKSILAVQIGNSITRGEPIAGFKLDTGAQSVLYFDFELSDKQFENRYSVGFDDHYRFFSGFVRVEIDPDAEIPETLTFEDYLYISLERSITETGIKILIIDNITYLKTETEKAKDALPLMKHLKALKSKYGLSILVLAHTPKRDPSKPISRNDLQGSKMLINFCDSAFSVGESSSDKSLRYLKQIKQRNTEQIYDADNVCVCHITKPHNFLQFEFLNFGTEQEHLKPRQEGEQKDLRDRVAEALEEHPGMSDYKIAKLLSTDESRFQTFKVQVKRMIAKIQQE